MHILIVPSERYLPPDLPLSGIFQQHQAYALKRAGYQIGIISPTEMRSLRLLFRKLWGWRVGTRIDDDCGIPVFRSYGWLMPRRVFPFLRQWVWAGMRLFRRYIERQGVPDLVHAHNAQYAGALACEIKKTWAIPYVITEHSSVYAIGSVVNSEVTLIRDAFRNADRRLVVSPSLGRDVERIVGEAACPWEWLPNILPEPFQVTVPEPMAREDKDTAFRFLSVGSLEENKGHADLLQAFARHFRDKSDVQLRIGGGGPLREELETLSRRLGIDRQTFFLGSLSHDRVLAEMQSCNAYVLSSHYETFGVALIEALACGKPVIATACGGPECIVCPQNGVLIKPRDPVKLGEAMATMRENVDSYDAAWIRQDCIARFGEQTIVARLSGIYNQVSS